MPAFEGSLTGTRDDGGNGRHRAGGVRVELKLADVGALTPPIGDLELHRSARVGLILIN